MVTRAQVLKQEVQDLLGSSTKFVQVKKAITRYSAQCIHPEIACVRIKETAQNALSNISNIKPFTTQGPYIGKIQFFNSGQADQASRIHGTTRESGDTVSFSSNNLLEVIKAINIMIK